MINLSGTGIDSTVTVSKLTISFGYWVSPTTGYTGSFDPGTFKWTANRTESSLWSTPTATGRTVTYTPDEFVNGGGTPDKPKKTTSSAPTPTNNLTFSLYTSSISNPATALVSGSSSNTLYIDVPFQWSNQSTWTTNMSRVSSKNGSCGDGSTIAYYQYAEFLIEYSKNGKSYSSRFWLVNGSKFS
nr:hypothetical protein [Actinomyces sp.]